MRVRLHYQEERRRERIKAQKVAREASLASKVEQLSAIRRLASAQASARKAAATMQRAQTAAAVLQRHEEGALKLSDRCACGVDACEVSNPLKGGGAQNPLRKPQVVCGGIVRRLQCGSAVRGRLNSGG